MSDFKTRIWNPKKDLDYFIAQEFIAVQELGFLTIPPSTSEEEAFTRHKADIEAMYKQKEKFIVFFVGNEKDSKCGYIWLATRGGGIPWDFNTNVCWIYDIRVKPEYRRKGLGKKLLKEGIHWAQSEGFSKIGLHVFGSNSNAYNLYRKMGFEVDHCYFQKPLDVKLIHESQGSKINGNYKITQAKFPRDLDIVRKLVQKHFLEVTTLKNRDVSRNSIIDRFEQLMKKIDFTHPKHLVLFVENLEGEKIGYSWSYRSKGDLGEKEYVWVEDLVIYDTSKVALEPSIIREIEKWTRNQGLDTIRLGTLTTSKRLWEILEFHGFRVSNYFLEIPFQS